MNDKSVSHSFKDFLNHISVLPILEHKEFNETCYIFYIAVIWFIYVYYK